MTEPSAPAAPIDEPVAPAPRRRRPPWWSWAVAALVTGLAAAWWLSWSAPVVVEGGFGVVFQDAEPGAPFTVGIETLCLHGARTAVIEDVTVEAVGLTVTDFAVRPRPAPPALALGSGPVRLAATGFGDARSFSGQCDDGAYTELAVELTTQGAGPAHTETIDVHWRAGVRSGVVPVPVSVTLCTGGDLPELCAGP